MKRQFAVAMAAGIINALLGGSAFAFNSGSTGADGALDVADNATRVLTLPASGIFNFTSVRVGAGAKLSFDRNANPAPVVMLASGDVNVVAGGTIDVSGQSAPETTTSSAGRAMPGVGGPGGYNGGWGGLINPDATKQRGGNGLGPGGGVAPAPNGSTATPAGGGGFGSAGGGTTGGSVYGVAELVPLIGGSGGAGGRSHYELGIPGGGGGGGGGAILIAASGKITVAGQILANGGRGSKITLASVNDWLASGAGGSGGAIHLMASEIFGSGTVSAVGGAGGDCVIYYGTNHQYCSTWSGASGGNGRVYLQADRYTTLPNVLPFYGSAVTIPTDVVVTGLPTIRIANVQNVDAPAAPNGESDIHLPFGTASPVSVKIITQGVTAGAKVVLTSMPRIGDKKVVTSSPIVPDGAGRAEVNLSIGIEPNQNTLFAITTN